MLALARSDAGAAALSAAGAKVHRGSLEDLESLRTGAAASDGVVHTGFIHDFSNIAEIVKSIKRAIESLGSALEGSERPLLVTSALMTVAVGRRIATEQDAAHPVSASYPRASEPTAEALPKLGIRASIVCAASVHERWRSRLVPMLIRTAREKIVSAFVGDGLNRWPGVHRLDAAVVYRRALEKSAAGVRYHAVADSSRWTRESLGWQTKQPGLISDIDRPGYFEIT